MMFDSRRIKNVLILLMAVMLFALPFSACTQQTADDTPEVPEPAVPVETDTEIEEPEDDRVGVNMVENGDFSDGRENWSLYLESGGYGEVDVDNGELVVAIINMGSAEHAVQIYYDGFNLDTGGVYRFAFDARSDIERPMAARLQINGGDYHPYIEEYAQLTTQMQRFSFEFTMMESSDPAPRLAFNMGAPLDGTSVPPNSVIIDNVEVTLIDASGILRPEPEPERPHININQLGYLPNAQKIAVFRGDALADTFEVIDQGGNVVFEGPLYGEVISEASDETNYLGDFSTLKTKGIYTITCGDALASYPFAIDDDVYDQPFNAVFKMLYLQRCGSELPEEYAGDFAHDACHMQTATLYGTVETKDVSGGWHDAGDYGRYVVPGATSVAGLLLAYEDYTELLSSDAFGLPESGNGIPDVLDEARYELEWLFNMQNKDGAVHHKVTGFTFPGVVMPAEETEEMVLTDITTHATGSFAAVMAMSYSAYLPHDKAFAKKSLAAAEKAWGYLEANIMKRFKNPTDILTGEYFDRFDNDERYWAAAALYRATGNKKYINALEEILESSANVPFGYGWDNVGDFGNRIYLSLDDTVTNTQYVQKIKDDIRERADNILALSESDGYGSSLGITYPWGSNMTVCNNAIHLLYAGKLFSNDSYTSAAMRHYHYLFGANPMSTCYVTGFGTLSPNDTHHRPSMVLGQTMPGMLVGGPNSNLEDPYASAVLSEMPPAKCYADNSQSFSCNEVTIYWNTPLFYLMANVLSE